MGEDEEKIEIELEHDDIDEMYYQGLWGFRTDEKYQFFMMRVIIVESFGLSQMGERDYLIRMPMKISFWQVLCMRRKIIELLLTK